MSTKFLLLSILTTVAFALSTDKCHVNPKNRLTCHDLNSLPRGNETVEVFRAENNSFPKIRSDAFLRTQLVSLKVAVLRGNDIEEIEADAFNGLSKLILLDLADNKLHELKSGVFGGAAYLKILVLSGNRLRHVQRNTFVALERLIYLDLSDNRLAQFKENFLYPLISIRCLDVSNNPLVFPKSSSVLDWSSLKWLRITLTGLNAIPSELFARLNNLQIMDLSGSNVSGTLPDNLFGPLVRLRVLYLSELSINESALPLTLEKFVGSTMDNATKDLVLHVYENVNDLNVSSKNIDFLQYLDDYVVDDADERISVFDPESLRIFKKVMTYITIIYLCIFYTLCVSFIIKSIYKCLRESYTKLVNDDVGD